MLPSEQGQAQLVQLWRTKQQVVAAPDASMLECPSPQQDSICQSPDRQVVQGSSKLLLSTTLTACLITKESLELLSCSSR